VAQEAYLLSIKKKYGDYYAILELFRNLEFLNNFSLKILEFAAMPCVFVLPALQDAWAADRSV
jgi:hypothetical protein